MASVPRPEYPRPQFVRADWLCLNGEWQFELDAGDSGLERGLRDRDLADRITVPFCPESELSGIGNMDFLNAVWYRRTVDLPAGWAGRKVLLHFQAVDYDTTVWANGVEVGRHRGGFSPFTCDLSGVAAPGETVTLVVRARDDARHAQPGGKQSPRYENYGCMYTRTTGIWQTVWLEPVPPSALARPRLTPDVGASRIRLEQRVIGATPGMRVRAVLSDASGVVTTAEATVGADFTPVLDLDLPADRVRLWSPADPHLYDLELSLVCSAGTVIDQATSYAGLRSVVIDGPRVLLNGEPVFQRLVLDQGYYPDGILTAPTDEALRADIELSLAVGFNGARLHQKVFEERFLYHADRLGYLVWGEFADWGADRTQGAATVSHLAQWMEVLERDYSHPSIIGWCPLNETHGAASDRITVLDDLTRALFLATKAADGTRPVLDTSGYSHRVRESDIYDCHDYAQDPAVLAANQAPLTEGKPFMNDPKQFCQVSYAGQPFFVSEFGGTWWNPEAAARGEASWGYGDRPTSTEQFLERFTALCGVLLDNPAMFGYCYTQLTDVYQEQNGLYTFDRQPKFEADALRAAQQRPAAIEQGVTA